MATFEEIATLGVTISLATNAAQVLGPLMEKLLGIHGASKALESQLGKVRAAVIGIGVAAAGWELGKGIMHAVEAASKLNHELNKLQIGARLTEAQRALAEKDAWRTSLDVRGSRVDENVKQRREIFGVFGNMDTARELQPLVAQASRVVANYTDKPVDLAQIAIRALELRGHITKDHKVDPEEFKKELNSLVRAIVASEGLIDPEKLFLFTRQAGPAARAMNADQFWGMSPALMNMMGAQPAGTAMMSLFSQFVGHVVAGKRVAEAMQEAGMLTPGKWRVERGGKVRMDQDAVPDQAGFMDHPFTWLHEHLDSMRQQKDKNGKPIDIVGVVQRIFQLASRATSARLISEIDTNWPVLQNEMNRYQRMPGIDIIKKEQDDKDYKTNVDNLAAAWDNLKVAIGEAGTPAAIGAMKALTDAILGITKVATEHPEATKWLLGFGAALSAIAVIGGLGLAAFNILSIARSLRVLSAAAKAGAVADAVGAGVGAGAGAAARTAATGLMAPLVAAAIPLVVTAAVVGSIFAMLKLGSDHETPATQKAREDNRKAKGHGLMNMPVVDGFDEYGRPILGPEHRGDNPFQKPATMPPPPAPAPVNITTQLIVDGRKLAEMVSTYLGNLLNKPSNGTTNPDLRESPVYPGLGLIGVP